MMAGAGTSAEDKGEAETLIRLQALGAQPDDGADDTPAFAEALRLARKFTGCRLILEPGRYDLFLDPTVRANPAFEHGLLVERVRGLTIDGQGAELVIHDMRPLFVFRETDDLTVRNLTIDWARLPHCGGRVIAVHPSASAFDLEVAPPYRAEAGMLVEGVLGYDPDRARPAYRGYDLYQIAGECTTPTELVTKVVMRVFIRRNAGLPPLGSHQLVRYAIYGRNAFTLTTCRNVRFDQVTLHAVPGMGLYADQCTDVELRHFVVTRRNGCWQSTAADATHFNNCRGRLLIEDCIFEGMGDDATNIHCMYGLVAERVDDHTLHLVQARSRSWGQADAPFPLPRPGDRIEIGRDPQPLLPYGEFVVEEAHLKGRVTIVRSKEPLPVDVAAGHLVANAATAPSARISRCTVRANRARGMLIQSRQVLVEDCLFEDVSGAALHIASDADYWWEGLAVRDVTIRGNHFRRCNYGAARRKAVIDIFSDLKGGRQSGAGVHREVRIIDNTLEDADGAALHVGSADGVEVLGNRFHGATDVAVILANCRNVRLAENDYAERMEHLRQEDGCEAATLTIEE